MVGQEAPCRAEFGEDNKDGMAQRVEVIQNFLPRRNTFEIEDLILNSPSCSCESQFMNENIYYLKGKIKWAK